MGENRVEELCGEDEKIKKSIHAGLRQPTVVRLWDIECGQLPVYFQDISCDNLVCALCAFRSDYILDWVAMWLLDWQVSFAEILQAPWKYFKRNRHADDHGTWALTPHLYLWGASIHIQSVWFLKFVQFPHLVPAVWNNDNSSVHQHHRLLYL